MSAPSGDLGVVVIARNEGERLVACLESLRDARVPIVYADSASSDGSPERARAEGAEVVVLDAGRPLNAARGRNAGWARLLELHPGLRYVFFVDGDCRVAPGFLSTARTELERDPGLGAVCGRRRELHPERSVYNRLCDMEWNTELGRGADVGGDSLMRLSAFKSVGGFDARLIAGEDPELSMRLRAAGFDIRRIDADMTWHDAAIERFGQWWGRTVRSGYTYAQWPAIRAMDLGRVRRRRWASALFWTLGAPAIAVTAGIGLVSSGAHPFAAGAAAGVVLAAMLCAPFLRARAYRMSRGDTPQRASEYAFFCVIGKAPEAQGAARYALDVLRGRRSKLIEYKHAAPSAGAEGRP